MESASSRRRCPQLRPCPAIPRPRIPQSSHRTSPSPHVLHTSHALASKAARALEALGQQQQRAFSEELGQQYKLVAGYVDEYTTLQVRERQCPTAPPTHSHLRRHSFHPHFSSIIPVQVDHLAQLQRRVEQLGASHDALLALKANPVEGVADQPASMIEALETQQRDARRSLASVVRDVDAILQGLSAATAGLPATLPPTSEPTKEFVARQHTKLAPYKPHAPGASSSFHDALSPGGADPLKERADDLLRAMV